VKTIYLLRHAKAEFGLSDESDFERMLTPTGKQDAVRLGYRMLGRGMVPQHYVGSPALRTRQTLQRLLEPFNQGDEHVEWIEDLYNADEATWMQIISTAPEHLHACLYCGHNPALTQIANRLSADVQWDHLPTCGLIILEFAVAQWAELTSSKGRLVWFDSPKSDTSIL
jgi:phosphohistidine phosphatase